MKSKQILDVQKMQHLQELGLELDYDTLHKYVKFEDTDWFLKPSSDLNIIGVSCKYIPAYTLQDILDALPLGITYEKHTYLLTIEKYYIRYESDHHHVAVRFGGNELIDAAYELLVWTIENKYVETNKKG